MNAMNSCTGRLGIHETKRKENFAGLKAKHEELGICFEVFIGQLKKKLKLQYPTVTARLHAEIDE